MDKEIVIPVTTEIMDIVKLIEEAEHRLALILQRIGPEKVGKYESEKEAFYLLILIIRNMDGFLLLAKEDLCLIAPAEALARPAFEIAIKILWILAPDDPFEREARWVAHLRGEEETRKKVNQLLISEGKAQRKDNILENVQNFREDITNLLLQKGYKPPEQIPNVREMMKSIGEEKKYKIYVSLCQSTHGSHIATWNYRRNLGVNEITGEFIDYKDWFLGFKTIWYSLSSAGKRFLEIVGEDAKDWLTPEYEENIRVTINKIM